MFVAATLVLFTFVCTRLYVFVNVASSSLRTYKQLLVRIVYCCLFVFIYALAICGICLLHVCQWAEVAGMFGCCLSLGICPLLSVGIVLGDFSLVLIIGMGETTQVPSQVGPVAGPSFWSCDRVVAWSDSRVVTTSLSSI